jgi:integrase
MFNVRVSEKKFEGVYSRTLSHFYKTHHDKAYEVCWQADGHKHWKTVGKLSQGMTPQKASLIRAEILKSLETEPVQDPTVDEIMQAYFAKKCFAYKHSYYKNHIHPTLGHLHLSELNVSKLEAFQEQLVGKGLAPSTITYIISTFRSAVKLAIRNGHWSGANPASAEAGFTKVKIDNKGERFLTTAEAATLLKALRRAPYWYDAASLSLLTGLRLCEIYRIRVSDINPGALTVTVTAKGQVRQPVLLAPEALEILERRAEGLKPSDLVFGYKHSAVFKRTVKRLGLNDGITDRRQRVWFHTMRHTFASWMAQAGVDIYAIQKLMRHKSMSMTQRYAHLMPDHQRPHLEVVRSQMLLAANSGEAASSL